MNSRISDMIFKVILRLKTDLKELTYINLMFECYAQVIRVLI